MELKEVKVILNKIKVYYPEFSINEYSIEEWNRVLKDYDFEDVYNKLNSHLQGENGKEIPRLNYLTRYLDTIEEKERRSKDYIVYCNLCKEKMLFTDYNRHYGRCLQVQTLWKKSIQLGNEIPREDIEQYGDDILDKLEEKYIPDNVNLSKFIQKI